MGKSVKWTLIRNRIAEDKYLGKVYDNDERWRRLYDDGPSVISSVRRQLNIESKGYSQAEVNGFLNEM